MGIVHRYGIWDRWLGGSSLYYIGLYDILPRSREYPSYSHCRRGTLLPVQIFTFTS